MSEAMQSTDELTQATARVLENTEWVIDGTLARVTEVGNTVTGEIDILTTAGMFSKNEWHNKMMAGEIEKV